MNNLEKIINKYNLHPYNYQRINNTYIIDTNTGKYVIKNNNNYEIYNYLKSRGFNYLQDYYNEADSDYDLLRYIEDIKEPENQKLEDLIVILSILHNKTSFNEEIDLDNIKEIYENIKNNLKELNIYYNNLNDYIDQEIFISPANYLLVRNISLFYYMINYANNLIDKWYDNIKNIKIMRKSLIHNNISIEHLINNEYKYLISWNNSKNDYPIKDIISFYKKYYYNYSLYDLLNIYESGNKLDDLEKILLIVYLSIPKKIEFTTNNYLNVKIVNEEITYLNKIYDYIKINQDLKKS